MANPSEKNLQLLASMGVRLSPRSAEKLSSLCGELPFKTFTRSPFIEQIQRIEVAISKTESLFTGESDVLKPCAYSSPVGFPERHLCVGHEMHRDDDCHLNLLLQELSSLSGIDDASGSRSKGYSAIVLLGVVSTSTLMQLIEQERPGLICCLFQRDEDWLSWVSSPELESLQEILRERQIVFRALPSRDMKVDLFSLLRDELFGFVGNALLVANVADNKIAKITRTFGLSFLNGLRAQTGGPCVDEFMMMFHTRLNCDCINYSLLSPVSDSIRRPMVVVGSGPSLDSSLCALRELRDHCLLISAGSSIGTLLRAGIRPHFHVHVERGYSGMRNEIYKKLLEDCGLDDFRDIIAVLPTSIDPDLPSLYKRVVMYARSGQTPVRGWPALKSALLNFEGPECLSAAFAFAMHLCPSRLFLFGCDLGAVSGSADRSVDALGHSPRKFNLKVGGNLEQFAMTNTKMLLQVSYMQAAYLACTSTPKVFNLSNGISLPFAKPLASLNQQLLDDVGDTGVLSADELFDAINSLGFESCRSPFDASQISSAKQWIRQWLVLAERAPSMSSLAFRLQASRLLSKRNYAQCELVYNLFRGSLRDGFWLTAFAVENYCQTSADVKHCWASFARFLKALNFEVDAIPSWLGALEG